MNFPLLTRLNQIIGILRGNLVTVALSLCALIGVVAIIKILLNQDMSPAARNTRYTATETGHGEGRTGSACGDGGILGVHPTCRITHS